MNLLIITGLLLVTLKLTGLIAWTWWLILAPFAAVPIIATLMICLFYLFGWRLSATRPNKKNRPF